MNNFFYTLLLTITGSLSLNAQIVNYTILDQNNTSASLNDNGMFFNNISNASAGFEYPSQSGKHLIYAGAFWYSARDVYGQPFVAAQTYGNGSDFWPGPLKPGSAQAATSLPIKTMWVINKEEIMNHLSSYSEPGYVIPEDIASWPAHGDVSDGFSQKLAPFIDLNNDGTYNPEFGDYPCIKGDRAVYMILNDNYGPHTFSNGQAIGIEMHYMFYQFESNDFINNTTFLELTVINRSSTFLYDFATSFFIDGDLGNPIDDYIGCDSLKNLAFLYNSDGLDESNNGINGYGLNPPALGIKSLNAELSSFISYEMNAGTPMQYYNLMHGKQANGAAWLDNNNQTTTYQYPGNPTNQSEWSEVSVMNPPGDRRLLMSIERNEPFLPQDSIKLSFAIFSAQDNAGPLQSVTKLFDVANLIQSYHSVNLDFECAESTAKIETKQINSVQIGPNPTNSKVTIDFQEEFRNVQLTIYDVTGKALFTKCFKNASTANIELIGPNGLYFLSINHDGLISNHRIVKN